MINRLSFVKVFNYSLRKIQEICSPTLWLCSVSLYCKADIRAAAERNHKDGRIVEIRGMSARTLLIGLEIVFSNTLKKTMMKQKSLGGLDLPLLSQQSMAIRR